MTIAPFRLKIPVLILACAVVLGGAVPRGQQRPPGGGGAPGGGGEIAIDFTVLGANGQVVPDLQPAEVSIKVAGKARTISSLVLKKMDATAAAATSAPPPFATNTPSNGRSILIVIDAESLRPGTERAIRESLEELFKGLGSADRVAFSIAPRDTAQVGFGAGLAAVRQALGKFTGLRPASVTTTDTACRTRDSLLLLRSLMEPLSGSETPTTVLFIASGLAVETQSAVGTNQSCEVTKDQYQALASAAASSRVNSYVVQGDEVIVSRDDGLEQLAGVTNAGAVLRASANGLARILAESAAYYVASVPADPADRPGQVQRLEVKVNRAGATTRTRGDVALNRSGGGRGGRAGSVSPKDMIRTVAPFTDLQLRATAYAARGQADKTTILVLAEPVDSSTKLTALTAGLVDQAGKLVFQSTADEKQLAANPVALAMSSGSGKYRLRVAATDANGRGGAVDYDLVADPTPAGPLKLGSLMLVAPRGANYAPQLQFSTEEEIAASVELYGEITGQVSAKMEVAASIDGPAILTAQPGGQGTPEKDKFILNAKIPIAKLAPGDYVVRVIVQLEGQPEGRVYRTLRKVAK